MKRRKKKKKYVSPKITTLEEQELSAGTMCICGSGGPSTNCTHGGNPWYGL